MKEYFWKHGGNETQFGVSAGELIKTGAVLDLKVIKDSTVLRSGMGKSYDASVFISHQNNKYKFREKYRS